MSGPVKDALTPEEWGRKFCVRRSEGADEEGVFSDGSRTKRYWTVSRSCGQVFIGGVSDDGIERITGIVPTADHALAALCLKDQPFGFTNDMVEAIYTLLWFSGSGGICERCSHE